MGSERDLGGDAECGSRACSTGWWRPSSPPGRRTPPSESCKVAADRVRFELKHGAHPSPTVVIGPRTGDP